MTERDIEKEIALSRSIRKLTKHIEIRLMNTPVAALEKSIVGAIRGAYLQGAVDVMRARELPPFDKEANQ